MTLRLSRSFYYWYFSCVWITSIQKQICQPFFKVSVVIYGRSEVFVGGKSRLVHLLQKKFKDRNIYLCVYIHVHVYLTYIADSWSKIFWKRMKMIANDLHRSMEICIATLHAASSLLFGEPLCHSPLHPLLETAFPLLPGSTLLRLTHSSSDR